MEEEHALSLRPGDDPRPGVAQPDCPVAPGCHQARRKGFLHSPLAAGNSHVSVDSVVMRKIAAQYLSSHFSLKFEYVQTIRDL